MRIGLALSGGGVRALVFHLGVLSRLAESDRWPNIEFVSTVSGGSLCIGLIYCAAGRKWPEARIFLNSCLPTIREKLTAQDLQQSYLWRVLLQSWTGRRGRAMCLAAAMGKSWGIQGDLASLPARPRWIANATCYETGKNWRFSVDRMGDYIANYVLEPAFPLAEVMAASAAVPGLIGPLRFSTAAYEWVKFSPARPTEAVAASPLAKRLTLWDGGVYDNLGVESLFKPDRELRDGIDFLIVSDASSPVEAEFTRFQWGLPPYKPPFRLIDIATDQVRSIRTRYLLEFLKRRPAPGVFLRIGNTTKRIFDQAQLSVPEQFSEQKTLGEEQVKWARSMETTLRRLTCEEFDVLHRHGKEVASATLAAYVPEHWS